MRCQEIRNRLTGSRRDRLSKDEARHLREHLRDCERCREQAATADLMRLGLELEREDVAEGVPPLTEMARRVDAQLSRGDVAGSHRGHRTPRWTPAAALAAAAVILLVCLVPFEVQRTVGYNVALDGVQRNLVDDNNVLCDLFYALGLYEADVYVEECDTTCTVQVLWLNSEAEAQMVVHAVSRLNPDDPRSDVIPITERERETLLQRVGNWL